MLCNPGKLALLSVSVSSLENLEVGSDGLYCPVLFLGALKAPERTPSFTQAGPKVGAEES